MRAACTGVLSRPEGGGRDCAGKGNPLPDRTLEHNQALEHFLAQTQTQAFHVAYGALWDREAALDVVQDSMVRLVEYYRARPPQEWGPLFTTILRSRINDVRRRRLLARGRKVLSLTGLFRARDDDPEDLQEAEIPAEQRGDGISDPEAGVLGGDLRRRLAAAVAGLPARQRQVFLLREQQQYSIQETAAALGCSENSVKQHHFRALRALRRQLAEVWEHE